MQKVEGSSPFIRSKKSPAQVGFFAVRTSAARWNSLIGQP
jgi:hypothetical protein